MKSLVNKSKQYLQFFKYAFVSVIALSGASSVFFVLQIYTDISVLSSNFIADFLALSFVFLISWKKIFNHDGNSIAKKYILTSALKIVLIFCLSIFLSAVDHGLDFLGLFADREIKKSVLTFIKIAIAPGTLLLNFYITKKIISDG